MAGVWSDPTSAGAVYPDPTAPWFVAPIVLPEPDPVFRDDALFASASQNWRAAPVPIPPLPVLDASGRLIVAPPAVVGGAIIDPSSMVSGPVVSGAVAPGRVVSGQIADAPPTAAVLRDRAVAALKAPPARYQAPASRGGSRSTYTAPVPTRGSRRPMSGRSLPGRPQGSVTTSPSTWLPVQSGPTPNTASIPNQWQASAPPPTWLPSTYTGAPTGRDTRPFTRGARPFTRGAGPFARGTGPSTGGVGRAPRPPGTGWRRSKGWIPGILVLGFIVAVNVVPHIGGWFHHSTPGGVDAAVNTYYTDMAGNDPVSAAPLVCDARQPAWVQGQAKATSDSHRGIVKHSIRSTKSAGSGKYTVVVDLNLKSNVPAQATVTVQHEDGTYHLCGGTRP